MFPGARVVYLHMTTIGFIGSGHIGSQVARAAIAAGYDVVMSNSRGPETLSDLIAELGPKSRAATAQEAAASGDYVVVTVPLRAYTEVPAAELAGKIVIDTNNYYFERDGRIDSIENGTDTVTGLLQAHLPESHVAKGFNHIEFGHITSHAQPAGSENRRALATASNFADAAAFAERFFNEVGFDAVSSGPLSESWRSDRGQPAYGPRFNRTELIEKLAEAKR
jgi:predicted dinucleotide-binding enzyme